MNPTPDQAGEDVRSLLTAAHFMTHDGDMPSKEANRIAAALRRVAASLRGKAPQYRHVGECATDETARQVCEGIYKDRCDDNLALCEALRAVYALVGQDKQIAKIVHDAIAQHGIDDA